MNTCYWYQVPMKGVDTNTLTQRLFALSFKKEIEDFVDLQQRRVRLLNGKVEIGIRGEDVLDRQEQVEYLVGSLGLDEEQIRSL